MPIPFIKWFGSFRRLERSGARLYSENRSASFWLLAAAVFSGMSLWAWDYTLDPRNAIHTVWLRMSFLAVAVPYFLALKYSSNRWIGLAGCTLSLVAAEACFLQIITQLSDGYKFGVAGFIFWVFSPFFLGRGFTISQLAILLAALSCAPPLIALVQGLEQFEYAMYLVTVLPAAVLCLLASAAVVVMQVANLEFRDQLELEATTDPLTGLGNRRLFHREVEARANEGQEICVLTMDLDRFKAVNDTYGHATGDLLLIEIARHLRAAFARPHEAFRIGGDEFVVLLAPGTSVDLAYASAQDFARSLPQEVALGDVKVSLSASFGVAASSGSKVDIEELLRHSDRAMYAAKRLGGGKLCLAA